MEPQFGLPQLISDPEPGPGYQIDYVHIKLDPDAPPQAFNPIPNLNESLPPDPFETIASITIPSLIPLRDITKCSYQDHEFCANCYQRITKIKVGKKFSDILCSRRGGDQNITVLEALNMIFELEQKSWLSETILDPNYQICINCTSSLTQLYKHYVEFSGLTQKPSYISSIIQHRKVVPKFENFVYKDADQGFGDGDYEAMGFEDNFQESESPSSDSFILSDKVKKSKRTDIRSSLRKTSIPSHKKGTGKSKYVEDDTTDEENSGDDDDYQVKGGTTRKRKLKSVSLPLADPVDSDEQTVPKRERAESPDKVQKSKRRYTRNSPRKSSIRSHNVEDDTTTGDDEESVSETHVEAGLVEGEARPMVQESKFECQTCGKKYRSRDTLRNHQASHRSDNPFACDLCEYATKRKDYLTRHRQIVHLGLRPHACTTCGRTFKKKQHLKEHETQHLDSSLRPFVCKVEGCTKAYRCRRTLLSHQESHRSDNPFACDLCEYATKRKNDLTRHRQIVHIGLRPYACATCGRKFKKKQHLQEHETQHLDSSLRPFVCKLEGCARAYRCRRSLLTHRISHNLDNSFRCDLCEFTAKRKDQLTRHRETVHLGLRPFVCATCGMAFKRKPHLRAHETQHLETISRPFVCEVEGRNKEYKNAKSLRSHAESHGTPFICETCGRVFARKEYLIVHTNNMHVVEPEPSATKTEDSPMVQEKKFECETCGKNFRSKITLKNHAVTHTEDRPYLCDLCGFSTKRSNQLIKHREMVHLGIRPYVCTTCEMSFKKKAHLQEHETKHLEGGHRPYVCEVEGCNKSYKNPRNLRHHSESHSGYQFTCETCGRVFARKEYLKSHVNTVHLGIPKGSIRRKRQVTDVSNSAAEISNNSSLDGYPSSSDVQ